MYVFWIALGLLLIGTAAHDLFHTLFHPVKSGALSDWIGRAVWKIFRVAKDPQWLTLGGPFAMLTIVGTWCTFIILGAALMYWPNLSKDTVVAPGLNQAEHARFADAVNLSLGSVVTFGGDVNAKNHLLRFTMGLEALLGFGVLTGSISWLLAVYPILERRSTLAHEAILLYQAEQQSGLSICDLPDDSAHTLLLGFATAITSLHNDMIQFPVTYYFHAGKRQGQFPTVLPYLIDLADRAKQPQMPAATRLAGIMLAGALADLLNYLGETFLQCKPGREDWLAIPEAYLRDHRNQPLTPIHRLRHAA